MGTAERRKDLTMSELPNDVLEAFHDVPCIVCGKIEKRWVDVFICDHCHKSGRAAVEFETLKRTNEQRQREQTPAQIGVFA
jgi:hypothetical protein